MRRPRCRPAFTLAELAISVAVTGLLLVGLGSAVLLSARALPDENDPAARSARQCRGLDVLIAELEEARHVVELTATAITFTVADRDADGIPERIRYAWSGTPGDPLTREVRGASVAVIDDVGEFALTGDVRDVPETYPGPPTEGAEVLLGSATTALFVRDVSIDASHWAGQYIEPGTASVPATALSWRVTRALFIARDGAGTDGRLDVQLRTPNPDRTPSTSVLEECAIDEANLSSTFLWRTANFSQNHKLSPGQGVCLALVYLGEGIVCQARYDDLSPRYRLYTADAGKNWSCDSTRVLQHYLYGRVTWEGPPQTLTRRHLAGVRIALRIGKDTAQRVDAAARLLNAPELLSAVWELDFAGDPTTVDLTADAQPDWQRRDGQPFDAATLVGGVWRIDSVLDSSTANPFTDPITIDARLRATSVGGQGVGLYINADWDVDGTTAMVGASLSLEADGSQTLTVYGRSATELRPIFATVNGLPRDFCDVRLLIDPVADTVHVRVAGLPEGTYRLPRCVVAGAARAATILAAGCTGEIDAVRIRVGGTGS